jgi:hypothetical protein
MTTFGRNGCEPSNTHPVLYRNRSVISPYIKGGAIINQYSISK